MLKVLVADDDSGLRESLSEQLRSSNYDVSEASDGEEALKLHKLKNFDLYLLDVDMPNKDGLTALKEIKEDNPAAIVIMLTAYSNVPDAVKATKDGAYNYLSKPIAFEDLSAMIKRALGAKAMVQRIAFSAPSLSNKDSLKISQDKHFLAKSNPMKQIFGIIEKLSNVDTAVLIRGESGTGKELVAKALHYNSARKDAKFVAVNCSAIPEELIESELFGHEKGAFTGATERKIGRFQYANNGTLFLDEIGDISPMMQVKLLRALQEKKFTPVGSNREVEVNVRIVAATNRNLEEMIESNSFREDLYYRLNVLPIFLPPLRERKEDIEILASHFVSQFNTKHGRSIAKIHPHTLAVLKTWNWPGNIRELENVIEHAFVMEADIMLQPQSLPGNILETPEAQSTLQKSISEDMENTDVETISPEILDFSLLPSDFIQRREKEQQLISGIANEGKTEDKTSPINWDSIPLDYHSFKDSMEKEFIVRALKASGGKINQTSRDSGIPKKTLLRKIQKYGIDRKELAGEANA